MKKLTLSQKLLCSTGIIVTLLSAVFIAVFYRGQTRLAYQEMDRLLENESLNLSSLVNVDSKGRIEFEISSGFQAQYEQLKKSDFFSFYALPEKQSLKSSPNSPNASCTTAPSFRTEMIGDILFRIHSYRFNPEFEDENSDASSSERPYLCLVVGINEAPYHLLVSKTIHSTLPFLALIIISSLLLLYYSINAVTSDLNTLETALNNFDFRTTHEFPALPKARTLEVEKIITRLSVVHSQAAQVCEEMLHFMGRAAHHFKTPVTAIQSTLDVLSRRTRTREELVEGISDLKIGVDQMANLTHKLMSSSRIYSSPIIAQYSSIDLDDFFINQIRIFRSLAKARQIEIELLPAKNKLIYADEFLLTEIFGNLIENAILYNRDKGKIRIEWATIKGQMMFRIIDEGHGFSQSMRKVMFDPFTRGDERDVRGSGLGLSIAKSAVHFLGGTIELLESSFEGSIFQIALPIKILNR